MHAVLAALALMTFAKGNAEQKSAVLTHARQFVNAVNTRDMKAAIAACSPDVSIVDSVPPYEWHGAGSMIRWLVDYAVDAKKNGITDGKVTLGKTRSIGVNGDHAYAVFSANYTFKRKGKPVGEPGSMISLALKKVKEGWRITAWTWSKG